MLKAGQTLLLPKPGQDVSHLWVVLLDPDPRTHETVIVNLTTQREHSETTTVLKPGEHPFVKHPTVAYYADARIADGRAIAAAIESRTYPAREICSAALLEKLREGLLASTFTPRKVKAHAQLRLA